MNAGGVWKRSGHSMIIHRYKDITRLHIEATQMCQALCPMCDRVDTNGEESHKITNATLTLKDYKHLFKPEFIQQLKHIRFSGNLGDPMLSPHLIPALKYFKRHNSNVRIKVETNGGARDKKFWADLAQYADEVQFAIDGLEDTNHVYRRRVVWYNIVKNVKTFVEAGGYGTWVMLIFDHNEHQIDECRELSKEWGLKEFKVKSTTRSEWNKSTQIQNPYKIDISTTEQRLHDVVPLCQEMKQVFIDALGNVYPCSWIPGVNWSLHPMQLDMRLDMMREMKKHNINALQSSLKEIVNGSWFDSFERRWNMDIPYMCSKYCNAKTRRGKFAYSANMIENV